MESVSKVAGLSKSKKLRKCEYCDYSTSRKNNWVKHLETNKHKENVCHNVSKSSTTDKFECENCKRTYKSRSTLYRHKKKCVLEKPPIAPIVNNIHNTNNINPITNNTQYNINVNLFLNENCKNAQTLKGFIDSINLSLKDLDYTTKNGYVEGISNILKKQLGDLSPTERPIHSTDEKRSKFMVKNEEGWVKDDGTQINKVVTQTKFKLVDSLTDWEKANPNYNNNPEKLNSWQKSLDAISPPMTITEKFNKAIGKKLAKLASIKEAMRLAKENEMTNKKT